MAASGIAFYAALTEAIDVPGRGRGVAYMIGLWFLVGLMMLKKGTDEIAALHTERSQRLGCWIGIGLWLIGHGLLFRYRPWLASSIAAALILFLIWLYRNSKWAEQRREKQAQRPPAGPTP